MSCVNGTTTRPFFSARATVLRSGIVLVCIQATSASSQGIARTLYENCLFLIFFLLLNLWFFCLRFLVFPGDVIIHPLSSTSFRSFRCAEETVDVIPVQSQHLRDFLPRMLRVEAEDLQLHLR